MDFEVSVSVVIDGKVTQIEETFEQFYDAVGFITKHMAQWNSHPGLPILVKVTKVPNDIPTLGVVVSDDTNITEKIS